MSPPASLRAVTEAESWVVRFRPDPSARLRLFCFPYAGGGAAAYRQWPGGLPAHVEAYAVQLPGREARLAEPPFRRLVDLIPPLARLLLPYLDVPVAFFGHSMGALVAFELARHLRRAHGASLSHLFVSALRAPHRSGTPPPLHDLPDSTLVERVRARWDGIPAAVLDEPELLDLVLPTLRADLSIVETYGYTADEPLDCPISCFGGLGDLTVKKEDLASWCELTRGAFRLRMFPGGHFFLRDVQGALLSALAEDLMPALERAEA